MANISSEAVRPVVSAVIPRGGRSARAWLPVLWIPLVLGVIFTGLFWGGGRLAGLLDTAWRLHASPLLGAAVRAILGNGIAARVVLWGVDAGLNAVLSVAIPYVLTFYLILALLQESGILGHVTAAADDLLVRTGLTATASLPLVIGAGCNVPAILSLRGLRTETERVVAGTLVTLVPCSARTAVVFGTVGYVLGWIWALGLYALVAAVIIASGHGLRRIFPGVRPPARPAPALRRPALRPVGVTLWAHLREFVLGAVPFVLAGSVVLGGLYETGLIARAAGPLAPLVEGWLRLPPAAGLTLIFAVLRKELALQLLMAMAAMSGAGGGGIRELMSPAQIFTYALVNTIAVPCTATIGVLARTVGGRRAAAIAGGTLVLALLLGGIAARMLAATVAWPR